MTGNDHSTLAWVNLDNIPGHPHWPERRRLTVAAAWNKTRLMISITPDLLTFTALRLWSRSRIHRLSQTFIKAMIQCGGVDCTGSVCIFLLPSDIFADHTHAQLFLLQFLHVHILVKFQGSEEIKRCYSQVICRIGQRKMTHLSDSILLILCDLKSSMLLILVYKFHLRACVTMKLNYV